MVRIRGLVPPVFTPFKKDSSLNLEVIPQYAEYLVSRSINGVYVAGTCGEGLSLSVAERKLLTEAWVKALSKTELKVIAMVGAAGLTDTQELAKHAESVGVTAIATIPPLYDKPKTVDELIDYCFEVASAAPNTPLFYYHIPFKTGVEVPMDEFFKKGGPKIPTLAGLKFTSRDVANEGLRCVLMDSKKFTILSGFDDKVHEALTLGYDGAISVCFNYLPEDAQEMLICVEEATKANETEKEELHRKAKQLQENIDTMMDTIFSFGDGFSVSALKMAMTVLTGIDMGLPRKPLKPLTNEQMKALQSKLAPSI